MKFICDCGYHIKDFRIKNIYLKDNKNFTDRKLTTGYCFMCQTTIAKLTEKRKTDNKIFVENLKGDKAKRVIDKEKRNILHTEFGQIKKYKENWVYGVNKEIKNPKGKVIEIRQYATNFKGGRDLVKSIKVYGT